MSYYSDENVATKYLDPRIYTENARCTFELNTDEAAYLPNLRLLNVGVVASAINDYNNLLGGIGIIKNARLLDGKTVLSQATENQFYQGFQNINHSNEENQSSRSQQQCTAIGLTVNGDSRQVERMAAKTQTNTNVLTTGSATLDLRTIFPMLNSISHLPTSVFKNLRIEIEFDAERTNQLLGDTATTFNTLRPVLAVDVVENPTLVASLDKNFNSASWLEVEHDLFVGSATPNTAANAGVRQNINVKINGYNNKSLERLLIVKEIQDPAKLISGTAVKGAGIYASVACFQQNVQFSVNGSNLLPRNGITGNNERLAYIVDTYGDCSAYIGSNQYGGDNAVELFDARNLLGQRDYIGVYVGKAISDLQINYSRVGLEDTTPLRPTTDALRFHCYGEVKKQIVIQNGSYNIQYA